MTHEHARLEEARTKRIPWRKWGPYLSERQWGTVREDYSASGDAWDYFTHDQARSRAYRWGEDGLAGISDRHQILCFALALWNGRDPILKERLFGLTNAEGNHGEDCKEYYFYLDSTPTHSYMKYLYKYPHAAFPYDDLVNTNRARDRTQQEYELLDTGVFADDRYFDVFVEYAKASPEDILIQISIHNRGPETAGLHVLPTVWFRNTWSWGGDSARPAMKATASSDSVAGIEISETRLGAHYLYCEGEASLLFTENDTNLARIFDKPNPSPFVKDGINNYLIHGDKSAVNPARTGTKAAAAYFKEIGPGQCATFRLWLTDLAPAEFARPDERAQGDPFGRRFDTILEQRRQEADEFYARIIPHSMNADQNRIMRQAIAGLLWSKQYYQYDLALWLKEHGADPYSGKRMQLRNESWFHMANEDVISMPDKWEYPWYASWDLAFHTLSLSLADPDFARDQINLMVHERYLHPSGQLPAYEWNFGDANPPVHAWATYFLFNFNRGSATFDHEWLKYVFHKLVTNFNWWVNRKDRLGSNVFEGGFLGLDNIGVFDRSGQLPTGGYLEQADGTAWMAFYSQCMLRIALELAHKDSLYEEFVGRFFEHFVWIAHRINTNLGMWDEQDGFFYDVLRTADGGSISLKVRSVVGLLPLAASSVVEPEVLTSLPRLLKHANWFMDRHPLLRAAIHRPGITGVNGTHMLALLDDNKLRRILSRMLDEKEFLSSYGIRALSRYHEDHPYIFMVDGKEFRVEYQPAESTTGLFGGNSNWRGPIWMPVNAIILRGLFELYRFYGDDFKVECPTGSGQMMTLYEVAKELSRRLQRIFLRDDQGRRPVYGATEKFQNDVHWRDHILFYEYFHGDNGAGIGASHQTGWTALIARIMQLDAVLSAKTVLAGHYQSAIAAGQGRR